MERDFMGLNSKDSKVMIKDEAVEVCKESVYSKSSAVKWSLSDSFGGSKNGQAGEIQQSPFSLQISNDARQAVPTSVSRPFYRAPFGGAPVKQHGVAVPSIGSFLAGSTEPWYHSKTSFAPAQLTIFYGGMVNVYNDISPEKAQAIMFLAGNGATATTPQPRVQPQAPVSRIPVGDASYMTQPISSPISVSSHPIGSNNNQEGAKLVKGSLEQVMQSAVPQARKASLARFLSKRKERVMSSAPYDVAKDSIINV